MDKNWTDYKEQAKQFYNDWLESQSKLQSAEKRVKELEGVTFKLMKSIKCLTHYPHDFDGFIWKEFKKK